MGEKVMAGDWLKFDKATPDKPEVFAIASTLDIDPDAVVGKLMRVWSWFDTHTENGNAPSVTSALLDRIAGVTGFVTAMQKCGWIELSESGVLLPNFNRHCGETAKKRAQNNNRVSKLRTRNAENVTSALQKHVPEKRREEIYKEKEVPPASQTATTPSAKKGTRLSADWKPSDELLEWAKAERPDLNLNSTVETFIDYWLAKAGKDGSKLDWNRTFKVWVRGEKSRPLDPKQNVVRPISTKPAHETPEQKAERKRQEQTAFELHMRNLGVEA
jgi:hypothetical protein